jgi:hypothetical protein
VEQVIATVAGVVVVQVVSLLALRLRLRSRTEWEHAHRRFLVAIVHALPQGGQIDERRADGSHLILAVGRDQAEERPRG